MCGPYLQFSFIYKAIKTLCDILHECDKNYINARATVSKHFWGCIIHWHICQCDHVVARGVLCTCL